MRLKMTTTFDKQYHIYSLPLPSADPTSRTDAEEDKYQSTYPKPEQSSHESNPGSGI